MAETPFCNATSTGDTTNVTCSANFRGERQYRPHFECGTINGFQRIVGDNDVGNVQTITAAFSFPTNITIECSVKFNKSGADLDGTALNTPELPWQWMHGVPGKVYYKLCDNSVIINDIISDTLKYINE